MKIQMLSFVSIRVHSCAFVVFRINTEETRLMHVSMDIALGRVRSQIWLRPPFAELLTWVGGGLKLDNPCKEKAVFRCVFRW